MMLNSLAKIQPIKAASTFCVVANTGTIIKNNATNDIAFQYLF